MWQGSTLVSEYYGGKTLEFFYDESGAPYGFSYKSSSTAAPAMYYYVTNLQGDVTNILDASGNVVASYTYNAWGKVLTATGSMASINPIRYRGYYFDTETGLYYLKSRYYDPELARFINADSQISTYASGLNLFSYCFNNPVNRVDQTGHWPKWIEDVVNWVSKAIDRVTDGLSNIFQATAHEKNKRPYEGEPGSTYHSPNGDWRKYGPDGKPEQDYDHDDHGFPDKHPHDENGGHYHDWIGGKHGDAYVISLEKPLGGIIVAGSIIGITIIVADNITGIGIADDALLGPLSGSFAKGIIMIFGG